MGYDDIIAEIEGNVGRILRKQLDTHMYYAQKAKDFCDVCPDECPDCDPDLCTIIDEKYDEYIEQNTCECHGVLHMPDHGRWCTKEDKDRGLL
jgi:hypothetical protein